MPAAATDRVCKIQISDKEQLRGKNNSECAYDVVSMGEVMLRLDPGEGRLRTARMFSVREGGEDCNVCLAKIFNASEEQHPASKPVFDRYAKLSGGPIVKTRTFCSIGNTHLEGAVIASAANPENNSLVTGTLTTSDIENESSYSAETSGWGGEASYEKNGSPTSETANKGHLSPSLPMNDSGYDSSRTQSAVADGHITITNEAGQLAATDQTAEETIASLNRDTASAHGGALERPANLDDLLAKQAELVEATAAAGKAVAKTVGDISQAMYINNDEDKRWAEGGIYKTILQGAGAALVGQLGNGQGLDAALGAMASQLAAGKVGEFAGELAAAITDGPSDRLLVKNVISNVVSGAIGAAVGGESGASSASNTDRNNRQLHEDEARWIIENCKDFQEQLNADMQEGDEGWLDDETAKEILVQAAARMLDEWRNERIPLTDENRGYSMRQPNI